MNQQIFLFAGTREGRLCGELLSSHGLAAQVFVATEYGKESFPSLPGLVLHEGRLSESEMEELLAPGDLVIDATHPYAVEVSRNLQTACQNRQAEYLRLLRPSGERDLSGCVLVENAAQAAQWLESQPGNVLLTTGSKELLAFSHVSGFSERFYIRVLPNGAVLEYCRALGVPPRQIIAMQGPFSEALNEAMLRQIHATILVTKDTGVEGGFPEKLAAARRCGVTTVVITRPQEAGLTLDQLQEKLSRRFGWQCQREKLPYFPIFLDLQSRQVLVIGGGQIAARRVHVLLRFGAVVTVVAPQITPELKTLVQSGKICWKPNRYQDDLSSEYVLVSAATDDRDVNRKVGEQAHRLGIPVSVCDCHKESSFYFPAMIEEGNLVGGLTSKDGSDHALVRKAAGEIREFLKGKCL